MAASERETYSRLLEDLASRYVKILRADLEADTYEVASLSSSDTVYSSLSSWLRAFANEGGVYEADRAQFAAFTDLGTIRAHFLSDLSPLRHRYRRLTSEGYRWSLLEIAPCESYGPGNERASFYVSDIHEEYSQTLAHRRKLEMLSLHDALTSLGNLHAYNLLTEELSPATLSHGVGVVFADINGLKHTNDTKGHDAGNELIRSFADSFSHTFGKHNCFRLSGDEFLSLTFPVEQTDFEDFARDFRRKMHDTDVPPAAIGYAWTCGEDSLKSIVSKAEAAMYQDKEWFYQVFPSYGRTSIRTSDYLEELNVLQILKNVFLVVYVIDLEHDTFYTMKRSDIDRELDIADGGVYSAFNDDFCNRGVHPDMREARRSIGQLSNLRNSLNEGKTTSMDFLDTDGTWQRCSFLPLESEDGRVVKSLLVSLALDSK